MTPTLTALLCLGLSLGLRTPVLAGTLPKPLLRAEPGSVVAKGTRVTISCEGIPGALWYYLYRDQSRWKTLVNPRKKDQFLIQSIDWQHAGGYHCVAVTLAGQSERSDPLELVVTDYYSKPSLSALPSPVVISGGYVTLQCVSHQGRFILATEDQKFSKSLESQSIYSSGHYRAQFSVGPVTPRQRWIFKCYSYDMRCPLVWSGPSDPLELLVSGTVHTPNIWAEPSSVITSGSPVTIWCQGTMEPQLYILHKEGRPAPWDKQTPQEPGNKAKFSILTTTLLHAGRYHCYCYSSAGWTERSESLELVVTGVHCPKPSLSALPSPVATLGGNMILQCSSEQGYDEFILTKENQNFSSYMATWNVLTEKYQAEFLTDPVTTRHNGTFRCYGYYKETPQVWSEPSDPVEIHISGTSEDGSTQLRGSIPTTGLEPYQNILIGVSVAFLILLFIIFILLLLLRCRRQGKHRKKGSADLVPRDTGPQRRQIMPRYPKSHLPANPHCHLTLPYHSRSNPAAAIQEENLYAAVKDMQPEENVELDGQANVSEEPQDVTYAQLCNVTLRRGTAAPPSSQAGEPSEEPSVYTALASAFPRAVPRDTE